MAKHAIVRTDNMHGTVFGADLVSGIYKVSGVATAIDNGCFVVPGAYATGEREVRVCATPAVDTAVAALALVASEEVDTSRKYNALADFENKAGDIIRCYKLKSGDIFSVTAEALSVASDVTPTVGTSILEAQAAVKGKLVNSGTQGSTKIADLVAIEGDWFVFRVV